MDQPAIDEEEARPRFFLTGPVRVDAAAAVLEALRPAGLLLRLDETSGGSPDVIGEVRKVARMAGVAFFADDVDLALQAKADGVQLDDIGDIRNARERLSEEHVIGAGAGLSRHDAMTAGENGADYVAFGEQDAPLTDDIVELVRWWRSTTVLPCLAYASTADEVTRLAAIGTDFIGIASAVRDHRGGPAGAAADLAAAMEKAEAYRRA